ncbi:MAG: hypothetical protein WKG00_20315 [Polyangiaceae bacterium]
MSAADITAGVDKDYTATGATHDHPVTVTAADFAALAAGNTVTVVAEQGGSQHTHQVTLVCG